MPHAARILSPVARKMHAWGARAPFWAQVAKVALGRRLRPRQDHACVVTGLFDHRGSFELRWLPQRQLYSLWFCLESQVYADIRPRLMDFAAGVDDLLGQAESRRK